MTCKEVSPTPIPHHPSVAAGVIATCERCGRPIRVGRPYAVGSRRGTFVHRGPCVVITGERGNS